MSEVSLKKKLFALFDDGLTLKTLKFNWRLSVLNSTLHMNFNVSTGTHQDVFRFDFITLIFFFFFFLYIYIFFLGGSISLLRSSYYNQMSSASSPPNIIFSVK